MSNTYYKNVLAYNGHFFSHYAINDGRRHYKIGEKTYPISGTGLLAFRNLADALASPPRWKFPERLPHIVLIGHGEERLLGRWTNPLNAAKVIRYWDLSIPDSALPYVPENWKEVSWPKGSVSTAALSWFVPTAIVAIPADPLQLPQSKEKEVV